MNLVPKSFLKLFNPPLKKKDAADPDDVVLDEIDHALWDLEEGLDDEDEVTMGEQGVGGNGGNVDNVEGLIDEVGEMSEEERHDLRSKVCPIRLALGKVFGFILFLSLHSFA